MTALRTRNSVLLAKIETTEGVDASPSASTDAVACENLAISFNPNVITTNEYTGSLDGLGAIVGGMTAQLSFDVYLKGNGTPGTAPEWGKLLKACGWSETLTATAVPAAPEACAAGGSTTSAKLGTSAVGTAELYRGMPIALTGSVAGTSFISDYSAAKLATLTDTMSGTIDAGTSYQVLKNALYAPGSTSIPSLTLYVYVDGIVYKFVGARGNAAFNLTSGGPGKITFTFRAMFSSKADAAVPAATYDATRPPIWKNGAALVNRLAAAIQQWTLDPQNQIINPDNPNSLEGYDPAIITSRQARGNINPLEVLTATRDIMSDFRSGTQRVLHARYGATAGNRIALTHPAALYLNQSPTDRGGLAAVGVPYEPVGADSHSFLCIW